MNWLTGSKLQILVSERNRLLKEEQANKITKTKSSKSSNVRSLDILRFQRICNLAKDNEPRKFYGRVRDLDMDLDMKRKPKMKPRDRIRTLSMSPRITNFLAPKEVLMQYNVIPSPNSVTSEEPIGTQSSSSGRSENLQIAHHTSRQTSFNSNPNYKKNGAFVNNTSNYHYGERYKKDPMLVESGYRQKYKKCISQHQPERKLKCTDWLTSTDSLDCTDYLNSTQTVSRRSPLSSIGLLQTWDQFYGNKQHQQSSHWETRKATSPTKEMQRNHTREFDLEVPTFQSISSTTDDLLENSMSSNVSLPVSPPSTIAKEKNQRGFDLSKLSAFTKKCTPKPRKFWLNFCPDKSEEQPQPIVFKTASTMDGNSWSQSSSNKSHAHSHKSSQPLSFQNAVISPISLAYDERKAQGVESSIMSHSGNQKVSSNVDSLDCVQYKTHGISSSKKTICNHNHHKYPEGYTNGFQNSSKCSSDDEFPIKMLSNKHSRGKKHSRDSVQKEHVRTELKDADILCKLLSIGTADTHIQTDDYPPRKSFKAALFQTSITRSTCDVAIQSEDMCQDKESKNDATNTFQTFLVEVSCQTDNKARTCDAATQFEEVFNNDSKDDTTNTSHTVG